MNRRTFITKSATAAALASSYNPLPAQSLGANERVNIAVIGTGWRGENLLKVFSKLNNVNVLAVCDADLKRMDKAGEHTPKAQKIQDFRKVLEMKDLDAVVIATPNHWHSPMAVLACQAGKHVYVEKPVSHGIWEGRKMVEAQEKYGKVMQAGTQQLSCPAVIECGKDIRSGKYGKVLWAHCFKINTRKSVGLRSAPMKIPSHIDYNLWAGPAPMDPIYRDEFHYDWHWDLRWGDGEMGNWAVHYTSDLCHMLGINQMPESVVSAGGRFLWDDAADAPNMLFSAMEYKGMPLTVEIRNLSRAKGSKALPVYMDRRDGNVIMCEKGLIKLARGGGKAYTPDGKKAIKNYSGNAGRGHQQNFIDAVRANDQNMLAAPIKGCHISSGICHLSNVSYKMGQQSSKDEVRARMSDYNDIRQTTEAQLRNLEDNEVDWNDLVLGPKLNFNPATETFTGDHSKGANQLLRYKMREEFALAEKV
ncbi:MAG: Gfo/Idh/MocA family protein [Opitutales bacterium]